MTARSGRPRPAFNLTGKRIFVAGARGLVGSAIIRRLGQEDCTILAPDRGKLDLADQAMARRWFLNERPDAVILAAGRVGGIVANSDMPAHFLYENLVIETNVIEAAHRSGVSKLLFLGSSCIYPKLAPQPMIESALLEGQLEPTNQWYAIAKIAGIKLTQAYRRQYGDDFISVLPTNLYGPGDNYDPETSHVLPALIRKIYEAKRIDAAEFKIWGTGAPRREFLHVDDLADACVFLMKLYSGEDPINIGYGLDISILELAELICSLTEYRGVPVFDPDRPDGTPRKLLDSGRLFALGWKPRITLSEGIRRTFDEYAQSQQRSIGVGETMSRPELDERIL